MGADLYLTSLPHCQLTDERKVKIREAVEGVPDKEVLAFNSDYRFMELSDEKDPSSLSEEEHDKELAKEVREDILEACFEVLDGGENPRDMGSLIFPGMNYRVLMSGGMSWGDPPTDSCDLFNRCQNFEPIWDLLQAFAEEDFKWQ